MGLKRIVSWVVGVGLLFCAGGAAGGTNSWSFVGPEGGPIYTFAIHPDDPQILLAGNARGIVRSTDRGLSWQLLNGEGILSGPQSIAFDPTSPDRVVTAAPFFMMSQDAGATFQLAQGPNAPNGIRNLVFTADGTLYAFLYSYGVKKSSPPFAIWTNADGSWPTNETPSAVATAASDADLLFAGVSQSGIYRTTNGGTSWSAPLNTGLPNAADLWIYGISVDPNDSDIVLLATSHGLYRSTNQGDSWTQAHGGPAAAVAINPNDSTQATALSVYGSVLRSIDGGATWPDMSGFQLFVYGGTLGIHYVPQEAGRMWFTSRYGISESTNGGTTFVMRNSGLRSFEVPRMAAADDHSVYVALDSASGSIFRRDTPNYQVPNLAAFLTSVQGLRHIGALSVAAGDSNIIFASNNGTQLIRTFDGGNSWSAPHPAFLVGPSTDYISQVELAPGDPDIAYVGRQATGVWKTDNGGMTFVRLPASPAFIHGMEIDPADPDVVYVGGGPSDGMGIYKTTDGGLTWDLKRPSDGTLWFHTFSFHPVDSNIVYAMAAGGLVKTTDGGDTWSPVQIDGEAVSAAAVLFDPLIPTTITMLVNSGSSRIVRSVDGGVTWSSTPLTMNGPVTAFESAVMLGPGELVVGTSSAGVVEYTVSPDLAIGLSGLTSPLATDSTANGTLTVSNLGPHAVSAAEISVTLPAWLAVAVPQDCALAASVLTCQMPALDDGEEFSLPLALTAAQAPGTGQISATVTGHEPDPVSTNNGATLAVASTTQAAIELVLNTDTPSAAHDSSVLFTATVQNPGPSLARNVSVELQLGTISATEVSATGNACTQAGATVSCTFGNLAAGSSVSFTVRGDVGEIGSNTITGSATRAGGDAEATDTASLVIEGRPVVDLGVEIAGSTGSILAGGAVTYTVTVRNTGPDAAASSVALQFAGVTVTSATTTGGTCSAPGTTITCAMNPIASGENATITVNTTAGAAGSGTVNAAVTADGVDAAAANNSGAVSTTVTAPPPPPAAPAKSGGGRFDLLALCLLGLLTLGRMRRKAHRC